MEIDLVGGERLTPGEAGDPLATLGLIDPRSGDAVPTVDWTGPDPSSTPGVTEGAAPAPVPGPPTQPGQVPSPSDQGRWDTPENPYYQAPSQQARQGYEATVAQLDAERPVAMQVLLAQGVPPQQAQMTVDAMYSAAVTQARHIADRQSLAPVVKREAAERVARDMSAGNVRLEGKDLMNEPTIEAMQARARTLVDERRNRAVAQRAQAGADRVESAGGTGGRADYDQLSPRDKIRLGVKRGQ